MDIDSPRGQLGSISFGSYGLWFPGMRRQIYTKYQVFSWTLNALYSLVLLGFGSLLFHKIIMWKMICMLESKSKFLKPPVWSQKSVNFARIHKLATSCIAYRIFHFHWSKLSMQIEIFLKNIQFPGLEYIKVRQWHMCMQYVIASRCNYPVNIT